MECANVRLTNRPGGGRQSQPHRCVALCKRCTMMRSTRPCAAATARESHVSHTPRKHRNRCSHGVREACDLRRR
eukprot:9774259-Lingulodinium_polyedra.AAC.1